MARLKKNPFVLHFCGIVPRDLMSLCCISVEFWLDNLSSFHFCGIPSDLKIFVAFLWNYKRMI